MRICEPFSDYIHKIKYRFNGETAYDTAIRNSDGLKDNEEHFRELKDITTNMRVLFGGRIQAAIGAPREITPFSCYVSGEIEDTLVGPNSIMRRLEEAATTMKMGGGIGYDWSTLRPKGAHILSQDTQASGPISYMYVADAICKTIASAGMRRGAQMFILRCDHPDIMAFIHEKHDKDVLSTGNMSVACTDEFMYAVEHNLDFDLRFKGNVCKTVDARKMWYDLMRSTKSYGDPGVFFIDTVNRQNNLWYCEEISCTNPCGEIPLPPNGACLLGSFNLPAYLEVSEGENYSFDWDLLLKDVAPVVRALDNVIDRATFPNDAQREEAYNKRRLGIGITGLANVLSALGMVYGSAKAILFVKTLLKKLTVESYFVSAELAREKGAFPLFDAEKYMTGPNVRKILKVAPVLESVLWDGIRNSHLTAIAPTGTISLSANNISSGIEPVWAYANERTIQEFNGPRKEIVYDYGYKYLNVKGELALDCSLDAHLNTFLAASRWVDNAVSKTINVPADVEWEDFQNIYLRAYKGGAKGCTTFTPSEDFKEGVLGCAIDPETGLRSCDI